MTYVRRTSQLLLGVVHRTTPHSGRGMNLRFCRWTDVAKRLVRLVNDDVGDFATIVF